MTMTYSMFSKGAGHGPRVFSYLLCLMPLVIPALTTGCSTSVQATALTDSCNLNPNSGMSCAQGTVYTCTGTAVPNYACTPDNAGNFCCDTGIQTTGSCTLNSASCSSSTGTSVGYSCTGTAQPEQSNPNLICNTNGAGDYCCDASGNSTCAYDPYVTGCESGTLGYSCNTGDPAPDTIDSTLVCSIPTRANSLDEYCCFTDTTTATGTCDVDPTVAGCVPDSTGNPSYGFSCTGSENPDTDFSNITCSTGTPDAQGNSALLLHVSVIFPVEFKRQNPNDGTRGNWFATQLSCGRLRLRSIHLMVD